MIETIDDTAPPGWDERAVDAPGGHVLQGTAWAAHRAGQRWRPRFVTFEDGGVALVLLRRHWPGWATAYCPRGPGGGPGGGLGGASVAGDEAAGPAVSGTRSAARATALAAWLRDEGIVSLAVDPVLDEDPDFERRLAAFGFRVIEEIQASRHRMILPLPPGATPDGVLAGVARSTRQRVRAAAAAGVVIESTRSLDDLERFASIVGAIADRKHLSFGDLAALQAWWARLLSAGQGEFLVARRERRVVGGLILYRQGGHLATAYSGDDPTEREHTAGTTHLLRWSAIRLAILEGHPLIDLGGVDVPGARRIPEPGEPTHGLYLHKRSFGAQWVASAPAHEVVLRPWRRGVVRLAGAADRLRVARVALRPRGTGR